MKGLTDQADAGGKWVEDTQRGLAIPERKLLKCVKATEYIA